MDDTNNGVLRCWEAFDWDDDDDDFADMTVRFEGKQMRIYGDFISCSHVLLSFKKKHVLLFYCLSKKTCSSVLLSPHSIKLLSSRS